MPTKFKSTLLVALFLFLLLAISACGESTPSSPISSSPAAQAGQTLASNESSSQNVAAAKRAPVQKNVNLKNWNLNVVSAEEPGNILVWNKSLSKSEARGTWLVIPVQLTNTSDKAGILRPSDFEVMDARGRTFKHTSDAIIYSAYSERRGGKALDSEVPPGLTIQSYLVFDIAADATGLQLVLNQDTNPRVNLGL